MAQRSGTLKIKNLHEVGNYAVGIQWLDGHDSIYPLDNLRRHCPCQQCSHAAERSEVAEEGRRLRQLVRIGDSSLFLSWLDGHETVYLLPELRALCRCAYCVGEPEKPLTGSRP